MSWNKQIIWKLDVWGIFLLSQNLKCLRKSNCFITRVCWFIEHDSYMTHTCVLYVSDTDTYRHKHSHRHRPCHSEQIDKEPGDEQVSFVPPQPVQGSSVCNQRNGILGCYIWGYFRRRGCENTSMSIWEYNDIRLCGYLDMRIWVYENIMTCEYYDMRTWEYEDIWIWKYEDMRTYEENIPEGLWGPTPPPGYKDIVICEYDHMRIWGYENMITYQHYCEAEHLHEQNCNVVNHLAINCVLLCAHCLVWTPYNDFSFSVIALLPLLAPGSLLLA